MRIVFFCHSLCSDWNHGNAHFLRGVVRELMDCGCDVHVYEPRDGWSRTHLVASHGPEALEDMRLRYPRLRSHLYDLDSLDLDEALDGADAVIVHEWNDRELVAGIGEHRRNNPGYLLFFHDTHHRSVTAPDEMAAYDLSAYDAVLAFGRVIARIYQSRSLASRTFVWHEAADHRVFYPHQRRQFDGDLVWIGNWGDEERTEELREFLIEPVRKLGLRARVYGVRYPQSALAELETAGIEYGGWIANYRVPDVFGRYRFTIHVPRRPYAQRLPGIPTIRVFEALSCGIPLICAPWQDTEGLFSPGRDYLLARDGNDMRDAMARLLREPERAADMAGHGRQTIVGRHTCAHRARELLEICAALRASQPTESLETLAVATGGLTA